MVWLLLVAAILFEVGGTTCMKLSYGFSRLLPSVLIFVFYVISFGSLTWVLKRIDVSVAYAVWSGLGTAVVAVIGILWFHESLNAMKVASLGCIILGVIGLHFSGGMH